MKKVLLIMTLLMSFGFSLQQCHEGTGWCFDQQTDQAFYFFHKDAVTFNYEFSSSILDINSSLTGPAFSAAAVGVGALKSDTKSINVVSGS